MFINCPYCNALVATDPATDIPPERCPRCSAELRVAKTDPASTASPIASNQAHPSSVEDNTTAITEEITAADVQTMDSAMTDGQASTDDAAVDATGADDLAGDIRADDIRSDADTPAAAMPADLMAADAVAEAMLGPGAIEVEIGIPGKMPDDDRKPAPEQDVVQASAQDTDARTPAQASDDATFEPASESDVATQSEAVKTAADTALPSTPSIERRAKAAPSFVRAAGTRVATPVTRGWRVPIAIVALSLLLALQLLLADRADLAESARWRPWIASLCNVLRCTIPPWREAEAFTLVDRDVRPHPTVPGVLRVTASFRNDARWPQPWPRLALTLSDVDGREAGTRRFSAAEYLGATPTQDELESGQTATIAMDVIEPAPRIVAFTFEFH